MPEGKTVPTGGAVADFVAGIEAPTKRADAYALLTLLTEVTGEQPAMWGPSLIGFGSSHYRYASGREGDTFIVGFSPRQQSLVLYIGMLDQRNELLNRLGPHKLGKGCLYIKRLSDVDSAVLRRLLEEASQQPRR
jgi:hypothetical protein